MKAMVPVLSFAVACIAVASVWAAVAMLWSPRELTLPKFFEMCRQIFMSVASVSALPALALYSIAKSREVMTLQSAAIAGFAIGAILFVLFFSYWISGSRLVGFTQLILMGGGLGAFGGLIFLTCEKLLLRVVRS